MLGEEAVVQFVREKLVEQLNKLDVSLMVKLGESLIILTGNLAAIGGRDGRIEISLRLESK